MSTSAAKRVEPNFRAGDGGDRIVRENIKGGVWEMLASWRDCVVGADAPQWFALESDPRAVRVKSGHHRSVWRVKLGERVVFAKVYDDSASSFLKRWFAKRASEREWRTALEMERRGIPVVYPIGFGVSSDERSSSAFLTEEFSAAQTLSSFWDRRPTQSIADVNALIRHIARLLAIAHERGFVPRDNHPGNILVHVQDGSEVEARFVDVLGAKLRNEPVSDADRSESLAQLDQFFEQAASRTQRLRFLHTYFTEQSGRVGAKATQRKRFRSFLPQLMESKRKHVAALVRRRDRRLRGDGKYFARVDLSDGWTGIVALKLARRRVFPEPNVADRCLDDWLPILRQIVASAQTAMGHESTTRSPEWVTLNESLANLRLSSLFQDYSANMKRGAALKDFQSYHQSRHRDQFAPLWLAVLEFRRRGLIAGEVIVFPTGTAEERARIENLP